MSGLLQDWVSEQAGRRPDAPAIAFRDERMTYGALELASNQLAQLLRAEGCRRGDRVCLLMPKSPMAIVAILGVLKADAIYVPLDPDAPVARLERMIAACDDRWILASGAVGPVLHALQAIPRLSRSTAVGWLGVRPVPDGVRHEFVREDLATRSGKRPPACNTPHDAAHILFTSGSTGTPKGVVVTHAAVRQ
ncbi:MAG: AMP-binding protein, partial [Gemmatimonadales bacterium]